MFLHGPDKGYLSRVGVGRRSDFQRSVAGDCRENERSTPKCGIGVGSVETRCPLERDGNIFGRNQNSFKKRTRDRKAQSADDRSSKHRSLFRFRVNRSIRFFLFSTARIILYFRTRSI